MKIYKSKKAEERIIETYNALLSKWETSVEEKEIVTQYGSTHVIIAGNPQGPPIMLFHGVGDDSALMWLYNAKTLAKEFRLFAIDTIGGAGKSRPNENYNSTFDDALWIDALRQQLGLGKVHLIGVSHGGYLVQYYNLVRHQWVDKVISMASSVPDKQSKSTMQMMMRIFFPEALFPTNQNVKRLLKKLAGEHVEVFIKDDVIMAHYKWLLKGFNNMAMRYHQVRKFSDEEIQSIKENTYYIVGEEDPFERLGGKEALIRHGMNARFYQGVGHGINHEIAEKINLLVSQILQGEIVNIRNGE